MDRGAWQAKVHGVTKSWTWLKRFSRHEHKLLSICTGIRKDWREQEKTLCLKWKTWPSLHVHRAESAMWCAECQEKGLEGRREEVGMRLRWIFYTWSIYFLPKSNCRPLLTHWKRLWCWEGLGAGGEGDDRGWDGWMALLTRWIWVWVNSGSWWWTGRPGVLLFMGSQRVGHDWATELNWTELI